MSQGQFASNLRGIPHIIFDSVIFYHHNPGLTTQDRKVALYNTFSQILAKYGEGDYKEEIGLIKAAFREAQGTYEPWDGILYATQGKNDFMNNMDDIQDRINRLIVNLGILDDATYGFSGEDEI